AACLAAPAVVPFTRAEGRAGIAAEPHRRRVSTLGDLLGLQATWRPTSWICNRVTGAVTGACVAAFVLCSKGGRTRWREAGPVSSLMRKAWRSLRPRRAR